MENRKHDPDCETQMPEDFAARVRKKAAQLKEQQDARASAEKLGSQKTERLNPTPLTSESPELIRKSSRTGMAATLAMGLMASSAATTAGYMYLNKKGPFAPVDMPVVTASSSAPETDENPKDAEPEEVNTNEDLQKILKANNVRATDKDFDFTTERPQLHAKALMFKVENTPEDGGTMRYSWVPVRNRITRSGEKELLVAVKIINSYVRDNPARFIAPEGLSYRARAVDDKDPTVMYFYYDCRDKKQSDLLGQIGLTNPQNPKKLLWGVSFSIPDCE